MTLVEAMSDDIPDDLERGTMTGTVVNVQWLDGEGVAIELDG